ncbi:MAG: hypothetical protein ACR652_23090 [Methylocystis sp.]|uniref:hypothetical protein n=1 Tax=Methylocystis sp. TaxID=1911079 RepID=UPI003DA31242
MVISLSFDVRKVRFKAVQERWNSALVGEQRRFRRGFDRRGNRREARPDTVGVAFGPHDIAGRPHVDFRSWSGLDGFARGLGVILHFFNELGDQRRGGRGELVLDFLTARRIGERSHRLRAGGTGVLVARCAESGLGLSDRGQSFCGSRLEPREFFLDVFVLGGQLIGERCALAQTSFLNLSGDGRAERRGFQPAEKLIIIGHFHAPAPSDLRGGSRVAEDMKTES